MKNEEEIRLYTLENNTHKIIISNFGAIIRSFIIKDVEGDAIDVVLGHLSLEDYRINNGTFGAVVGRHANRIKNAFVEINEQKYQLEVNHFNNNLHTGKNGLQYQFFDVEENDNSLVLTTTINHLEDGFPGNLDVRVTYELHEDTLSITYDAVSDADTIVNLTNHSYFNLNKNHNDNLYNHNLYINSELYMPNDEQSLVQKEILSSKNTPFDFSVRTNLEDALRSSHIQVKPFNGIDHNFLLDIHKSNHVVTLDNGLLALSINTDLPAMHVYTGNHFPDTIGKHNQKYPLHGGIAFETQLSPNSLQMPWLQSPRLKKGEHFSSQTSWTLKKLEN